jgi:hypothetical protein
MWQRKYKLVGIQPGRIFHPKYGYVDFSRDDLSVEICDKLFEEGCPYLEKIPPKAASPKITIEKAPE